MKVAMPLCLVLMVALPQDISYPIQSILNNNNNNHHHHPLRLLLCCSGVDRLAPSHVINHPQPHSNIIQLVIVKTIAHKAVCRCGTLQVGENEPDCHHPHLFTTCFLSLHRLSKPHPPSVINAIPSLHTVFTCLHSHAHD